MASSASYRFSFAAFGALIVACSAATSSQSSQLFPSGDNDAAVLDAGQLDSAKDDSSRGCGSDHKECGGACVTLDDPNFGCGGTGCDPCLMAHAKTATCNSGACAVRICETDYADCDGDGSNGCEAALKSNPSHCGACDRACDKTEVCSNSACKSTCDTGLSTCTGACVDLKTDPDHCGRCEVVCPTPAGGLATCTNEQCGIQCNTGYHECTGVCASNSNAATCGTSCTPCPAPTNGTATCDGTKCGIQCNGGYHVCNGACADNTSVATCGTSCTPCTPPANGTSTCNGTACDFTCNAGFQKSGGSCVAITGPTLTISSTVGNKATGTFLLDPNVSETRPFVGEVCPNVALSTTVTNYQYVTVINPTAKTATISVWDSLASGGQNIDTVMVVYASVPTTDPQRGVCLVGLSDFCNDLTDPTSCIGADGFDQWAGLMKADGNPVTIPPNGSVVVYTAAYYATTATEAHSGSYLLSARTESLQ
jgi:hypothetical protein